MQIECIASPSDALILRLSGEMDAQGCVDIRPSLEQVSESEQRSNVVIDLKQVSFLDSSGIGAIVFLFKRLKAKGRALEIVGVQGQLRELMELLRIGTRFQSQWLR